MSIFNALFSTPMTAVTAGPGIISLGMSPRTEAGFNFMKGFDEGAITSIADAENAFDFEQFGKDLVAVDAANQAPVNNMTKFIPQVSSPRAMGAEEIKTLPNQGIMNLLKSGGAKVRDTFLKGIAAQGGLNIGANLGFAISPALTLPFALGGAFLGATGIRDATPGEKGIQNIYGGQNTIGQGSFVLDPTTGEFLVDPITGEPLESEMAGYNISSMFGKGLPSAIQSRIDRINKTLSRKDSAILSQRLQRLEAEKAAAEAAELAAQQEATRALAEANRATAGTDQATGGYQSSFASDTDFMEGDPTAGGQATTATMGSFKQGGIVGLL
tara:strand:- start:175 stop:1158 length:984 start_codon:yes stop_codon:yes gene_type:complete